MSDMVVICQELFDGDKWCGPTEIVVADGLIQRVSSSSPLVDRRRVEAVRVPTVLPGLVDFGVSASGYAETPTPSDPFLPERSFARMSLRYGITTLVDVNNSIAPLRYLESLGGVGSGPHLVHSGARFASFASSRHDVLVTTDNVERLLEAAVQSGAKIASLGLSAPEVVGRVERWALSAAVPLVISAQGAPELPGLSVVAHSPIGEEDADVSAMVRYVAPQLHASSHWTVKGLLDAPNAHFASPVLPHCRNFLRGRGRIGRRIAEPIVGRYYPDREERLLDPLGERVAAAAVLERRCLASSAAGATGMVPGLSLWAELDRLAHLAKSGAIAMSAATSVPADILVAANEGVRVGRVAPGFRADLLFTAVGSDGELSEHLATLSSVVVAGRSHDISSLAAEVDDMISKAMRGEL